MYVKLYLTTLASVNYIAGFHEGRHTSTKCYIKIISLILIQMMILFTENKQRYIQRMNNMQKDTRERKA